MTPPHILRLFYTCHYPRGLYKERKLRNRPHILILAYTGGFKGVCLHTDTLVCVDRTHATQKPGYEEMALSKEKCHSLAHNHKVHRPKSEIKPLIGQNTWVKEMLTLPQDTVVTEDGLDWKVEYNLPVSVFEKKKVCKSLPPFLFLWNYNVLPFKPLSSFPVNWPGC